MELTGAGLAGAVTAPWLGATPVLAAAADADADLVVFNAKVYTSIRGCRERRRLR